MTATEASTAIALPDDRQGALELLIALERSGHADEVGLELTDPDMPYERWEAVGRMFGDVDRRLRWYLGDWLNFGEAVYGHDAAQAVEGTISERYDLAGRVTGLAVQTLMNYSSVCARVPRRVRRVELPFSVHEAVANLSAEEQTNWLERAVQSGWKREDLRREIREAKGLGSGDSGGGNLERLTRAEQIEYAAEQVYQQGQPNADGRYEVPPESWHVLATALGHE